MSPYRTRTLVIYDKVKQAGIESVCKRVGLPTQNMVEWKGNGIEFVYPDLVLASVYRKSGLSSGDLTMDGDSVSYGDLTYKKMDLCKAVTAAINETTQFSTELLDKLIEPMRRLMG